MRNLVHLSLSDGVSKTAHSAIGVFQHQDAATLPRHRNAWPSFMPVGDERSTAESHPRCGGGCASALPPEAPLPAEERSWRALTPRMIAVDTLSVQGKISDVSDHPSLSRPLQCCSVSLLPGQAETIQHRSHEPTGAGHHYIVQPRSSRVTTRGHPADRARTIGQRRAAAKRAERLVSRPPSTGLSPHHAGGEGVSISATTPSGE